MVIPDIPLNCVVVLPLWANAGNRFKVAGIAHRDLTAIPVLNGRYESRVLYNDLRTNEFTVLAPVPNVPSSDLLIRGRGDHTRGMQVRYWGILEGPQGRGIEYLGRGPVFPTDATLRIVILEHTCARKRCGHSESALWRTLSAASVKARDFTTDAIGFRRDRNPGRKRRDSRCFTRIIRANDRAVIV